MREEVITPNTLLYHTVGFSGFLSLLWIKRLWGTRRLDVFAVAQRHVCGVLGKGETEEPGDTCPWADTDEKGGKSQEQEHQLCRHLWAASSSRNLLMPLHKLKLGQWCAITLLKVLSSLLTRQCAEPGSQHDISDHTLPAGTNHPTANVPQQLLWSQSKQTELALEGRLCPGLL